MPQNNAFEEMLISNEIDPAQVIFHIIQNEDVWFRDYGPTFVINSLAENPIAMVKWTFTAWGNKYDDLKLDNHIPYDMNNLSSNFRCLNLTLY